MTTQHPEALRLADELDAVPETGADPQTIQEAAAELRRQHARIAELEARIKAMAEEHADELMVAHMDGRMRVAQPAGAQQPTTQPAPQQEAQEPVAWYVTGGSRLLDEDEAKAEVRRIGGTARAMPLYTTPQPTHAQAGAVPLSAGQYNILVEDLSEWSRHVEVDTAPRSLEEHIHQVFAIHGIKGGQHGAE